MYVSCRRISKRGIFLVGTKSVEKFSEHFSCLYTSKNLNKHSDHFIKETDAWRVENCSRKQENYTTGHETKGNLIMLYWTGDPMYEMKPYLNKLTNTCNK